jgi:hypothetical protein
MLRIYHTVGPLNQKTAITKRDEMKDVKAGTLIVLL